MSCLNISGNELGPSAFITLRPIFVSNCGEALTELYISNNKLNNQTASDLANQISKNENRLKTLDLSNNQINCKLIFKESGAGVSKIFHSLKGNAHLIKLILDGNDFSVGNVDMVGLMLNSNWKLRILSMANCKMTHISATEIGEGLG